MSSSRRTIVGLRWVFLILSVLSSTFLFALDNTIVAAAQPQIVLHFAAVDRMAWLSVAFAMAALSTNMLFGQLYSRFPPKWLYIASVVVFEAGSAMCGAAWGMTSLIVGRAVCGLSGIGMYVGVLALLTMVTTVKERLAYIWSIGIMWGLGTILGPVVGGALTDSATWRWAFYIDLPFGALILPAAFFLLPPLDPNAGACLRTRMAGIDFVGGFLLLGATSTLVMAINFSGLVFAWASTAEIALFSMSGALFVALGFQQAYSFGVIAAHRIIPWRVLTASESRPTVALMTVVTAAGRCGIFLPVYFLPLFFQFTRGDGATDASLRLLPFISIMIGTVALQGILLSQASNVLGMYMPWYALGGCLTTAGGVLLYLVRTDTTDAWLYGSSALLGVGVGMIGQAGFGIAQACLQESQVAMTVALVALGQTGGITFALAVSNTVFIHEAEKHLRGVLGSEMSSKEIHAAIGGVATDMFQRLPRDMQQAALRVLVDAMALPYILIMVAGVVTVLLSFVMRRERIEVTASTLLHS